MYTGQNTDLEDASWCLVNLFEKPSCFQPILNLSTPHAAEWFTQTFQALN